MPVAGPPAPSPGSGTTTVSALIEETRRLVYGTSRLAINRVLSTGAGLLDTDTTVTLDFDLQGAVKGSIIAIDNELFFVLDSTAATKQLTVIRGYLGTTPVVHAAGAIVEVNPRFPRPYIKRALQQEINSWGSRLFKVTSVNIPFSSLSRIYDLGIVDYLSVLDVRLSPAPGRTTRPRAYGWAVIPDQDTSNFASGTALELLGNYPTSGTARVKVSQKFDVGVWDDTTVVENLGLTSSMTDIPPIGAAWRLMSAKEVGRTDMTAQPEPRKAEEVPAGHMASVAAQLKKLRDDRIEEERWTLMQRYPLRGVA